MSLVKDESEDTLVLYESWAPATRPVPSRGLVAVCSLMAYEDGLFTWAVFGRKL